MKQPFLSSVHIVAGCDDFAERGSVSRSTLLATDALEISKRWAAGKAAAGHRPALLWLRHCRAALYPTCHFHLPLSLPSPRAGATRLMQRAGRGIKGTAIELASRPRKRNTLKRGHQTGFRTLGVHALACPGLNSMAVGIKGEGSCAFC